MLAIILVLAGLVLAASSYVHNKGARSRAEAEIAAISAALENYKADNGIYPNDEVNGVPNTGNTDTLDSRVATPDFAKYQAASIVLYQKLIGDTNGDGVPDINSYMTFKPNQLSTLTPTYVQDPFGYSYGYSTAGQAAAAGGTIQTKSNNPTFDLWSTSGSTVSTGQVGWVKNW